MNTDRRVSDVGEKGVDGGKASLAALRLRSGDFRKIIFSLPVILSLAVAVLLAVGSFVYSQNRQQQVDAELDQGANTVAHELDAFLSELKGRVSGLAGTLEKGEKLKLATALPDALEIKLIELGELGIADFRNAQVDALRHIERDLLRRALEQQGPVLDAYRDDKDWVISVAQPVKSTGALLAGFPKSILNKKVAALAAQHGWQLKLLIQVQGKWQPLAAAGSGLPGPVSKEAQLGQPLWAVQVNLPYGVYQNKVNGLSHWLYLAAGGMLIIALINFLIPLLRIYSARMASLSAGPRAGRREDKVIAKKTAQDKVSTGKQKAANVQKAPEVVPSQQPVPETVPESDVPEKVDERIFRAYDIRGDVDSQLSLPVCCDLGRVIGSELLDRKQKAVVIARDGRNSSPRIRDAVVEGLRSTGITVVDIGAVPTPVMHFATHHLVIPNGVMITGSHNPKGVNGLKLVMQGKSLTDESIQQLRVRLQERRFITGENPGEYRNQTVVDQYVERIKSDIVVARRLKVVVDAANGIAGPIAPRVFQALGCAVEPLFCELDGDFPNHNPDPTRPENLEALKEAVAAKRADVGIALDGDGDRVVFVGPKGDVINPDQAMVILARDVITRSPGAAVVYDVKCSRILPEAISEAGGLPIMSRSGHSFVKNQVEMSNALMGGEFTGHIFFRDRWYGFDDGIYVAARMLELLSLSAARIDAQLKDFPTYVSTLEYLLPCDDARKFEIVEQIKAGNYFADGDLNTMDGLRVEFPYGWGLVRASNTTAGLTLRFEAETAEQLAEIQGRFREVLTSIDPGLKPDF